ncbi:DUF349 domain-containing protein [uncultured Propionibacterium sp.]|uniref:DUF349 domain-containing protein n=1 Tax=uncultured Propionibacterium sp. TaxID=218066 RepID=UPI0037DC1558
MNTNASLSGKIRTMSETPSPTNHGRVDADGTVYVITSTGERRVGQVPDAGPDEAMAFFARRYESLSTEVNLLKQRIATGSVSPDEARKQVVTLRANILGANAVGDLEALVVSLDEVAPLLETRAAERREARARQHEETRAAKEGMVAEAERLAAGNDWRGGVNRFRALLEQWKALPRIDRATDDELWHRFSSARTTYTRRRKAQFAQQAEHREAARRTKERIIVEAERLSTSTEWGPTARAFRDLMARWKAAGPAPREVDDELWRRFRGLQDVFFDARNAVFREQDAEFAQNLAAKQALLDEAEKSILPVTDVEKARRLLRDFLEKFNACGRVPRDAVRSVDGRVRAIEQAVREAEEKEWRRTDPQARERAADTVAVFASQIEKLSAQAEAAEAGGDSKKANQLRETIATYQGWLDQAQRALDEFSP